MIHLTLSRQARKPREIRTFQCVTCLGTFTVRFLPTKRSCIDCEQLREDAKKACTNRIYREVKAGRMPPPTAYKCADCGDKATMYEHRDYTKPLDVEPVCRSCNTARGPARL